LSSVAGNLATALNPNVGDTLAQRIGPLLAVIAYIGCLVILFLAALGLLGDTANENISNPAVSLVLGVLGPIVGYYLRSNASNGKPI